MSIMHATMVAAAGLLSLGLMACDSSKPTAAAETAKTAAAAPSTEAGGTVHKPPIQKDAVPDGHYYCDMGTVHYSRADQGDGKCPLCKMNLTQK